MDTMSEYFLEQVNDLWEISEYMNDKELTEALEFVAKVIVKPDIPAQVASMEIVRLQAIAAKLHLVGTYMANVTKNDRPRKNIYYSAASEIDKVVNSLKYYIK